MARYALGVAEEERGPAHGGPRGGRGMGGRRRGRAVVLGDARAAGAAQLAVDEGHEDAAVEPPEAVAVAVFEVQQQVRHGDIAQDQRLAPLKAED